MLDMLACADNGVRQPVSHFDIAQAHQEFIYQRAKRVLASTKRVRAY